MTILNGEQENSKQKEMQIGVLDENKKINKLKEERDLNVM